jgi:DNA invertase Pin-like site-specific DNA recombinase
MVGYREFPYREVNNNDWSRPTSPAEVIARAGGRRRYNARRQDEAIVRRCRMLGLLREYGHGPGVKARIARELGVHRSTITRDYQAIIWVHERECRRV